MYLRAYHPNRYMLDNLNVQRKILRLEGATPLSESLHAVQVQCLDYK